ncbi:protein phosphatase 2C domain-containing protein [Streptomyces sp. NBC_01803]|uniref:protein phosphatase 2C domain-containing protein n=1 Tax=Streptomyces sp. NBC_01803 TaxID=2975946 RepID=UPI002DD7D43C|nr:protein phosphatase 2C domain-containing protein [Streptomyces sp. NBC_01803]WSA44289.1 protein phosphatase 2C domain-containing protein [Streptomyces sp. NBC_01803]
MRVHSATEPGTPGLPNEDFAATAVPAAGVGGALVLLDGVTAPAGDFGCHHGVAWFAARLGGALLESTTSLRHVPLAACLAGAISRTAEGHRTTCDLSHPRTPQATVVCARWDDDTVEYLVLSDSALLIEGRDGVVRPVLDTRLDDLRPAARRLPRERRAGFLEGLRNAEGGFFTAAADPAVAARALTGSMPRAGARSLAAVTDGLGRWVETFRLGGWPELFAVLAGEGPAAAIARVRAAEAADPAGVAFPRGKAGDDATAIMVEL